MGCNMFAIKNQMFKGGNVWHRQQRFLDGVAVKNAEATPPASGPGLTEVVKPRAAGLTEGRKDMRLLPCLCKAENVYTIFQNVVIYEPGLVSH